MPKVTNRAEYNPTQEAERVMSQLPPDKLKDKEFVWAYLDKAKIKLPRTAAGRVRSKLLRNNAGYSSSASNGAVDIMESVNTVLKILPSVGGLEGLERAVAIIRRVKEKA